VVHISLGLPYCCDFGDGSRLSNINVKLSLLSDKCIAIHKYSYIPTYGNKVIIVMSFDRQIYQLTPIKASILAF